MTASTPTESTTEPTTESSPPPPRRRSPVRLALVAVIALVVFVAANVAADRVEERLDRPWDWHIAHAEGKLDQMEGLAESGPVQVAFVGSSTVNRGVDPAQLDAFLPEGWRSYNAALGGGSYETSALWAEDVVMDVLDPEILVVGVTARMATDDHGTSNRNFRGYRDSPGRRHFLGLMGAVEQVDWWARQWVPVARIRDQVRTPWTFVEQVRESPGRDREFELFSPLGRHEAAIDRTYREREDRLDRLRTGVFADFEPGQRQLDSLRAVIRAGQQRGVQVVLVELPVYLDAMAAIDPDLPAGIDDLRDELTVVAEEEGVPFLPVTTVWPEAAFSDEYHLNGDGASVNTARIGEFLASLVAGG